MLKTLQMSLVALVFTLLIAEAIAKETSLTRVLFIGNSYLYYNDSLHNHVERMAQEQHPGTPASNFQYKSATIGGARLEYHNIDWLLKPGQIGVELPFQVVIMQGGSFEPLTQRTRDSFIDTASTYADKVRQIGAKPMLYMTHTYVAPHRRASQDMIKRVSSTYIEAGRASNSQVIPVGLAYERSYRQRPDFSLHADFDGTHPNLRGTYLGACVVYLALYGGEMDGLDYDYFGRIPKAEALYLQRVAAETVKAFAEQLN